MRKIVGIIIVFLLASLPLMASERINIDGYHLVSSSPVITAQNRTLVPVRDVFTSLGASVHWEAKEKRITAEKGASKIILSLNNKTAIKNGQAVSLDAAPLEQKGVTYVPLRFVAEAFGAVINMDPKTKEIRINTANYQEPKITLDQILEPLDFVATVSALADVTGDRVKDYIFAGGKQDQEGGFEIFGFVVADGLTGMVLGALDLPYYGGKQPSIKVKMIGDTPQIIYSGGYGDRYVYSYKDWVLSQDHKSNFIKDEKVVVDKSNLNSLFTLSFAESKDLFGAYQSQGYDMYFKDYNIALYHDINDEYSLPYSITFYQGSEFMGLDFTQTPAQVRKKLGSPLVEGLTEMDGDYVMVYQILGHEVLVIGPSKTSKIDGILVKYD